MKYVSSAIRIVFILIWTIATATLSFIIYLFTFNSDTVLKIVPGKIWAPFVIWVCGAKIKYEGRENISREEYFIYVSNHTSQLDIPATVMAIDIPLYFMLKREIKKVPFLGWYVSMLGMIYVDRKNRLKAQESIITAGKLIKEGKNVLVYAEGTRSEDGEVKLFRKGAFKISKTSKIGIVPFHISGTREILGKGSFIINSGQTINVNIGKLISYDEMSQMSEVEMANFIRQKVIDLAPK